MHFIQYSQAPFK